MGPKKKDKKKVEEVVVEESGISDYYIIITHHTNFNSKYIISCTYFYKLSCYSIEYDTMDLEMLREVVPMLRQQLEKSMLDRNYVQLERVSFLRLLILT